MFLSDRHAEIKARRKQRRRLNQTSFFGVKGPDFVLKRSCGLLHVFAQNRPGFCFSYFADIECLADVSLRNSRHFFPPLSEQKDSYDVIRLQYMSVFL